MREVLMYAAFLRTSNGERLYLGRFNTRAAATAAVERCKATRRATQAKLDDAAAKAQRAVARKARRDSLRRAKLAAKTQAKLDAAAAKTQAKLDAAAAKTQAKLDAAAEKAAARQAKLGAKLDAAAARAAARQARSDAAAAKAAARKRRELKSNRTAEQIAAAHQRRIRQQAEWRKTKLRGDPHWAERYRARKRRQNRRQMESPIRRAQRNRAARENHARRKASRSQTNHINNGMNYHVSISQQQGGKVLVTRSDPNWTVVDQTQFDRTDTAGLLAFTGVDSATLATALSGTGASALPDVTVASSNDVVVLAASGSSQATAARVPLNARTVLVTPVAAGTGVMVAATVNVRVRLINRGANALLVYPPTGAQFESTGINAPVTVAGGGAAEFVMTSATQGYAY